MHVPLYVPVCVYVRTCAITLLGYKKELLGTLLGKLMLTLLFCTVDGPALCNLTNRLTSSPKSEGSKIRPGTYVQQNNTCMGQGRMHMCVTE